MIQEIIEIITLQTAAEDQFADLIELAFLDGAIDGKKQELAYLWIINNQQRVH